MSAYSEIVMDHFKNPHNMGKIENPDGVGEVGNPVCGDMMTITIKVRDDRIDNIKFETFGCGAAIAVSSMVTEMAKGKTLEEALKITNKTILAQAGELPKNELHCSHLGAEALHKAIMNYYAKKEGQVRKRKDEKVEHISSHQGHCYCPYCNFELIEEMSFCVSCGKPTSHNH